MYATVPPPHGCDVSRRALRLLYHHYEVGVKTQFTKLIHIIVFVAL